MRLTKFSQVMTISILSLMALSVQAQSSGVVAKVNGVAIPQSRLELMVKASVAQGQTDGPEMRKALRENLIAEEILAQEATKKKLDKDSDVIAQLEIARQAVLVRAYQADYIKKNVVSDETLRKEYEMLKVQMGDKEYKARHILVDSESVAKEIIASLKKGGNFAKIAEEKSLDEGSKENGGELNWSPPAAYVRPFSEALVKLSKGSLTEQPVQTSFGWHVIQLMDTRPMEVPPFEEVKQNIQQRVLQREFATVVQELRSKAKVE
ncbi:peptidylprolyl isomerase [Nitrosomonas sp. JL21]|uniref:peptidylprolyl isomerase n=1 Tax=Nitrosomonas sp. JL21 TaxID=153949 RepID=UPI00136AF4D4|nr:peptidylprolyl isomerase [Nitrosomonas sp. JL21]MBL8496950.1 peptidylprolyl isomerase [Nitrosomonas sp.]MXS78523.1 peptidylprolyl isomerase [Nitrosomonas sp. JL21]